MRPFRHHGARHRHPATAKPAERAPHATDAEPRLRAAITRLQQLEGSVKDPPANPASTRPLPPRLPAPSSGDRGEWVAAGMH